MLEKLTDAPLFYTNIFIIYFIFNHYWGPRPQDLDANKTYNIVTTSGIILYPDIYEISKFWR